MKITFLVIGKTEDKRISDSVEEYFSRIRRYVSFEFKEIPALKNSSSLSKQEWKSREGDKILHYFQPGDHVVLLDERGKEMTSLQFSAFLTQKFNSGMKNLWFVTGGPFGFDDSVKKRADFELSLSKMTFPHQLVRLFFAEQLYRALSIMKNESYHHE